MLYKKNIDQISWEDVESFCEQRIAENAYLDYKESFPKNLSKSISAFANTLGGIIIIGVEEDEQNKPVLPVKGIPFERGLSEKITNIILGNITPPIFPEIQVCVNENETKAIIVIRIAQSNQTPHAISGNTQVYIRTGNLNHPESIATLDQIFWLDAHRKKSTELKNKLIKDANIRFNAIYENEERINKLTHGFFTLLMCPLYPKESFLTPPELNEIISKFFVIDYYRTSEHFPINDNYNQGELYHSGSIAKLLYENYIFYNEFNIFGLNFNKQVLYCKYKTHDSKEIAIMRESEILSRLDQFIDSSILFYDEIGYRGLIEFRMNLNKIKNYPLGRFPGERLINTLDDEIEHIEIFLVNSLNENKKEIILNKMKKIAWTFGFDYNMKMLEYNYNKLVKK